MSVKPSSDKKRILKGISLSWLKFFLTLAIGVIQTPLLFKYLPTNELNAWYIFYSFGGFLLISDLGLVTSISRIIAYLDNAGNSQVDEKTIRDFRSYSTKQIYTTSLFFFSIFLILFSITVTGAYYLLHRSENPWVVISFLVFIVGIVFNLLADVPTAVLNGFRDVGYDSMIRSSAQLLYFIVLVIFLPYFKSIVFVSGAFLVQNLLVFVTLHFILKKRHKKVFSEVRSFKELIQVNIVKKVYSQSFPLAINQVGTWLTTQGSVVVASVVLGPNKLSDYAVNQQLFSYAVSISLVINQIIGPFVAKQYIENQKENLITYYKNTTIASLCIVCLFLAALFSCCDWVIDLWIGPNHFLGYKFAIFFALITFFEVQHSVAGNFVWNMGKWPFNYWTVGSGLLNILLAYVLGSKMGLLGIAIASFASKITTLNWYVVYYCLKRLGMSVISYLKGVFVPITVSVLGTIFLVFYMKGYVTTLTENKFLSIILISAVSSIVFAMLAIVFFRKELKPFLAMLRYKMGMVKPGGVGV
ncbi:MAG: oligosaccharide flippase family protein [Williamsia sp.]|nr:oligosaccharide flippase family protein [Williamsia sp.]